MRFVLYLVHSTITKYYTARVYLIHSVVQYSHVCVNVFQFVYVCVPHFKTAYLLCFYVCAIVYACARRIE